MNMFQLADIVPTRALLIVFSLWVWGCAPTREAIPPGTIPAPTEVSARERQYGEQVARAIVQKYPRVRSAETERSVERIVRRLGRAAGETDWNVYVLQDDSFENAAATQGNKIFVWTGMLRKARSEAELATVIAHEMGHVLARHVVPTPDEQVNQILTGVSGSIAQRTLSESLGGAAGVAGSLVQQSLAGVIVNPESQRKELEADTIGLTILAEAGYNPEAAVSFWRRAAQEEPGSRLSEFLSTHPTSERRLQVLQEQLPQARARYRG
jgi:predicted Zn-dependent protease